MPQLSRSTANVGRTRRIATGLIVTPLLAATAVIGGPVTTAQAATGHEYEMSVARLTNHERTSRGLVKLTWGSCLDRYAEAQAKWMAKHQNLQHQNLRPILGNCDMNLVGENIAVGYPTAKAVTRAWMKSPGHRENILKKQYRRYGLGAYKDSHGRWWVSHVFGRRA
ncbi:MAG TPA: CAP domain-containing protein [Microlunatus sp.]